MQGEQRSARRPQRLANVGRARASLAKITAPRAASLFPRPRLLARLDAAAAGAQVVWIAGPPGAGKTTLAVRWLAEHRRPALWYRVDAGDQDIASFFHYLDLAVAEAAPRCRTPLPKLTPEYLPGLVTFTRNFFRELGRRLKPPFVLVFDNLHELGPQAPLHDVLCAGLEELPPQATAVLLSRTEHPPAFARWQLEGRLGLLDWNALRLLEEESVELVRFFDAAARKPFSAERAQHLHRHCHGWFAGMMLLLQQERAEESPQAALDLTAAQQLFDYFAGEVFNRRHPAVKEFLMLTALFPNFTAAMAEKLTGNSRARPLLEDLVRQHHFTEHHAGTPPVYEYHPLFRAFLNEQGRATWSAAELERLRYRAALLLEQAGYHEEALQLYLQSGDWAAAVRLVLAEAQSLVSAGRLETLRQAIARLPSTVVEQEPWLLYWRGVCRLLFAPQETREDFERAYAAFDRGGDAAGLYLSWAAIMDSFLLEWRSFCQADKWIAELEPLRRRYPRFPSPEVEGRVMMSAVQLLVHRQPNHPDLPSWAERGEALRRSSDDDELHTRIAGALLIYYLLAGRAERMEQLTHAVRSLLARQSTAPTCRVELCLLLAIYEWCHGDPEAALRVVDEGWLLSEKYGVLAWKGRTVSQGVYAALVLGDAVRASRYLPPLASSAREGIEAGHYHYLAAMTSLHGGDLPAAVRHIQQALRLVGEAGAPFPYCCCLYLSANIAFVQGRMAEAKEQLAAALALSQEKQCTAVVYCCYLTQAALLLEAGKRDEGSALLRETLAMSRAMKGPSAPWLPHTVLARLYASALEHGIERDHVVGLIRRFRITAPTDMHGLDTWPFPLKIYTLGRFTILKDDTPLNFTGKLQRKPLELLKALIALGGRAVSDTRLIESLWPDAEGDRGRHALEMALSRLRKLLGHSEAILSEGGGVSLNPHYLWLDVWALEQGLEQLARAVRAGVEQIASATALAERMLALYRGPFLVEERDASWALTLRERLRARLLRELRALWSALEQAGHLQQAAEGYQRGLEIDPLAEEFYQRLMHCYRALNRPAEALAVYQRCRQTLHRLLAIAPSPETERIAQTLRQSN